MARTFSSAPWRKLGLQGLLVSLLSVILLPVVHADTAAAMAPLAAAAYQLGSAAPHGFSVVAKSNDQASGFQGVALTDATGRFVVVSFAGTQPSDFNDVLADVGIGKGEMGEVEKAVLAATVTKLPGASQHLESLLGKHNVRTKPLVPNAKLMAQLAVANRFYDEVASAHKGKSLSITGHSLGGYLAQAVASRTGVPAVTFNAPGASAMKKGDAHNITNYIRAHDIVGMFGTHIGQVVRYHDVHPNLDPRDRYVIRNHSISQFIADFAKGLQAIQ